MAGIRANILSNVQAKDDFIRGMVLLDQERPGVTAADVFSFLQRNLPNLRLQGINQDLSTYDLFVLWHVFAMNTRMATGNGAHSNPLFLPWHRMYLLRLEENLQRVLNDNNFGLPYWDWAADGELGSGARQSPLWTSDYIGESRGSVNSSGVADIRVRLEAGGVGRLFSVQPRPIVRNAASDVRTLPRKSHVRQAVNEAVYDRSPWSMNSSGHRNRLEGWINGPQLHNRVHVWVGGDMGPGSSPNDPVFFLNHCNVDRIWEAWMEKHGRTYNPQPNEGFVGQRLNDAMIAILGAAFTPNDVLDPAQWYRYDSLNV